MTMRILASLALGGLMAASPYLGLPGLTVGLGTLTALLALCAVGLNLIFGVLGMLAFGQAAFMSLPGYIGGVLEKLGTPLPAGLLIGLVLTLALARAVAEIFVRLPGMYLAVGTLGFGFVVEGLARAFPAWTGGASGLVFSIGRDLGPHAWYLVSLVALGLGLIAYAVIVRGARARRFAAIRHDELSAAVMGVDVVRWKARAFTMGSAFAAIGGTLLACYVGVLVPENAGVNRSLEQVGTIMLGGLGSLLGPVVGTLAVQWLFVVSGYAAAYELLIYGVAFLATVLYAPRGIVGLFNTRVSASASAQSAPEPSPVAPELTPPAARRGDQEVYLRVQSVSKYFGGVRAIDGVSFEVRAGEIFAMVGPNGAGKSTLFNLISGLETPTAGSILVMGRDFAHAPIHERAPLMGRSFQVARLVPELTVLENVMVRLDQIFPELSESQIAARALAQLQAFDLQNLADRQVRELSAGQHKLIDLARASAGDPPLLLLDEPAVGLGEEELEHLARLLARLRAQGSAIVIVEHNINFVRRVADRGVVLDSGLPIASGAIADILADKAVQDAYFGALT